MPTLESAVYTSPWGPIELHVRGKRLAHVLLHKPGERVQAPATPGSDAMRRAFGALDRYLRGQDMRIGVKDVALPGGSPFRRRVFRELLKVGFGEVVTYGQLGALAGSPNSARAVGQAVGANPLPVFVPCHRVVAAAGGLGGFGAGLGWKRALLGHEGWQLQGDRLVTNTADCDESRTCVYAGSFDPPTEGHMHMIRRGAALFGHLIVAVGVNPKKRYTFTAQERVEMLRECVRDTENVTVESFEGQFLVHYARSRGARYVLRGIRTDEDYRFEHALRNVNEDLEPGVTTVFLIPPREICEVSSSFVKGLVGYEGWEEVIKPYVPVPVYERLLESRPGWHEQSAGAEGPAD